VYPDYPTPSPAGYGTAPGYGAAPLYGQPGPYIVGARGINRMAVAAMIVSLAGLVACIACPVGAVLGHVALNQIRRTGEQGKGFATTGIIVGWIGTAVGVVGIGGFLLIAFTAPAGAL